MKKLFLLIVVSLSLFSCKKENIIENVSNYTVTNYISSVPFYSVKIHNDTLTCVGENNTFEYLKISENQFKSNRIYWNNTQTWTGWNDNKISYFSGNTLYIIF